MHIHIRLFAGLAEVIGASSLAFHVHTDEVTAAQLKEQLSAAYPEAASQIQVSMVAVNREYATGDTQIAADAEVALIPPVSGGEPEPQCGETPDGLYSVSDQPLDAEALLDKVLDRNHGASLVFVGTTREMTGDQRTTALFYEAYVPMALGKMQEIGRQVNERWNAHCAIAHRTGLVGLKEASVIIAVSAGHRDVCYEASRFAIEQLKATVPVWKKDLGESGSQWIGADPAAAEFHNR
ncbi:molybdopterin converting factor subunit 1 [Paenibacillus tengchongensis]|uniref:molybdopterin converting factor subunit 1 n=1 Tax=Paenibacillus tengchongensis TaxID=2608684 RepID=UPI00124CA7AC|nr:molybdopterin converting factor subunit 1 [Paenibacillus tengchongensis]